MRVGKAGLRVAHREGNFAVQSFTNKQQIRRPRYSEGCSRGHPFTTGCSNDVGANPKSGSLWKEILVQHG